MGRLAQTLGVAIGGRSCFNHSNTVFAFKLPARAESMIENQILKGACHCGKIKIRLPAMPEKATKCNCSICRRLGTVWAYYEFGTVKIEGHPENTEEYIQGDRTLSTVRCKNCGCVTHWEPLDISQHSQHGVNLNNFNPTLLEKVNVRCFDGADTWKFIE
jgi:hypothetical protein